jgi:hypothetical protein
MGGKYGKAPDDRIMGFWGFSRKLLMYVYIYTYDIHK